MKKLFIITGEHSGDLHASNAVKALKNIMPDLIIEGIGGKNMQKSGVKIFRDHSQMGVVGLNVKAIIDHIKLGRDILDYLKNNYKPDLVLLVDYGGFNLKIAKELKKNKIETFYFISPQVWASRKGRENSIRKYISKLMVIFPFEEKFHQNEGVNAEYVGHPLISQLPQGFSKEEFIKQNKLDPYKKIVGIFPGSRKFELNYMMPIYKETLKIIYKHSKKVQFCLAQADNIPDELLSKYLKKFSDEGINLTILKNQNHALLFCSDVLILTSGTVTLEAALYETPMAVCYKASAFLYLAYLLVRHISKVSLPNIISEKDIVKEFIQHKANPEAIAMEILGLLHDEDKRNKMKEELKQIKEKFGDKIASEEVAKIIKGYFDED
ncbi:MAG: lipid-A-disaccharide synthase [Candidatus Gastranaerophilaceae bacterium]|jgi:lipid-A-disaccharide synthase